MFTRSGGSTECCSTTRPPPAPFSGPTTGPRSGSWQRHADPCPGCPARCWKNTGRPQALKIWSLWCAAVLLSLMWSSPATAITPPWRAVPAMLACLNTSEQRTMPRPLPYQMPNTPSYFLLLGVDVELLRAPHGRGAELLVHAGLEHDMAFAVICLRAPSRAWS